MTRIAEPLSSAAAATWLREHGRAGAHLRVDSRAVEPGDIFVALPGRRSQGANFIATAVQRGAAAVLLDADGAAASRPPVPLLALPGLARALGPIAAEYYGHPTAQLRTIGITGTNGKTSSCQWLAQVLSAAGEPCATLGTLGFGFGPDLDAGSLTTPDAASVQRLARAALERGARALAMEVSSIGLDQGRVDGVRFAVALFTNLSRDHLDYHPDMAAYAAAKRRLIFWPGLRHAVINLDDDTGRELAAALSAADMPPAVTGVTTRPQGHGGPHLQCQLRAQAVQHRAQGLRFSLECERAGGVQTAEVEAAVLGDFNVANLLGVIGAALACGVPLPKAVQAVATLQAPPGRLQRVPAVGDAPAAEQPTAIVDYAHTPDAITKALRALRPIVQASGGRLCIVFGAGGDRDRGKRPVMAAAAAADADDIVLTSDNPRGENVQAILDDLVRGMPSGVTYRREADRAAAIRLALDGATARDVVLIAGKGHEEYQEVAGQRLPFSDLAVAQDALRHRAGARP